MSHAIPSHHTLTTFLCHAVAANRAEQKTLTLVVPNFIALQPAFFCDLAECWKTLREKLSLGEDTSLRVDCCRGETLGHWPGGQWLAEWQQRIDLFRNHRAFSRQHLDDVISVTRCLVIGRPSGDGESIVMGVADPDVALPDWVKPAPMLLPGTSPSMPQVSSFSVPKAS